MNTISANQRAAASQRPPADPVTSLSPNDVAQNLATAIRGGGIGSGLSNALGTWLAARPAAERPAALQQAAQALASTGLNDDQQDAAADALVRAGQQLGIDAAGDHAALAGLTAQQVADNLNSAAGQSGVLTGLQNDLYSFLAAKSPQDRATAVAQISQAIDATQAAPAVKQSAHTALSQAAQELSALAGSAGASSSGSTQGSGGADNSANTQLEYSRRYGHNAAQGAGGLDPGTSA